MLKAPCLNCKDRQIIDGKSCHCTCEKYLEFRKMKDEENEKLQAIRKECEFWYAQHEIIEKRTKKKYKR